MLEMANVMESISGDEAEELRRAMSFHRSEERMQRAEAKLQAAMDRAGVRSEVSDRIVKAVGSFALYGFPESHAISFAHLAYASAYLKMHYAPEFYCALLNNQPMGFYSSATLVKDAKRHGVKIRPVCIARSEWLTAIDDDGGLRLGLRQVQGLNHGHADGMLAERKVGAFVSMDDLRQRTKFSKDELRTLAEIGALNSLSEHRRAALWEAERTVRSDDLFSDPGSQNCSPDDALNGADGSPLRPMDSFERTFADYSGLRLTTGPHPMALVRERLEDVWRADDLKRAKDGDYVRVAGQVICRQRPGTAKGVCFVSLEDETGICNVIVGPAMFEAQRLKITTEPFLLMEGFVQSRHETIHIQARAVEALVYAGLDQVESHDFH